MKKIRVILLLFALTILLTACGKQEKTYSQNPIATITMDDGQIMRFELYPDKAPETVAQFIDLANRRFYDGQLFFRVVSGVLIQSGDPNNTGTGGSGTTVSGEFSANGWRKNTLSHTRGAISLARRDDYDSGSSQFFIMQGNYPEYDGFYAVFGMAADEATLTTIDNIAKQPVDSNYMPLFRQKIATIRVETFEEEEEETTEDEQQ